MIKRLTRSYKISKFQFFLKISFSAYQKPIYHFTNFKITSPNKPFFNSSSSVFQIQSSFSTTKPSKHQKFDLDQQQNKQMLKEKDTQLEENSLDAFKYQKLQNKKTHKVLQFEGSEDIQQRKQSTQGNTIKNTKNDPHTLHQDTNSNSDISATDIEQQPKRGYEEVYEGIKNFRSTHVAPVDTMGCHMLGDKSLPENDLNFQKLVGILLSVQTKDEITHSAMKKIETQKLGINQFIDMPIEDIKELIGSVNYSQKKAQYIKEAAQTIKTEFDGKVPDTYEQLISLKGVGAKVANLFMQCAYDQTVGIAVDTHVHRISNRLGWVDTTTPEQTRVKLEQLLEKKLWQEVNSILVGFGQIHCKPINPLCESCPVQKLCPQGMKLLKKDKNKIQKKNVPKNK